VYTRQEGPSQAVPGAATAVYESANGAVRVYYRTRVTAADKFSWSFLVDVDPGAEVGSQASIDPRKLCRWCLETFCFTIELKDGTGWKVQPFSWTLLETLGDEYAEDPWPADLSAIIVQDVLKKHSENLAELKKTSMTHSGTSTWDGNPAVPPSHS
jgi:hypothetical protein